MIKFFNQRGRGSLSTILMGVGLLILVAIVLLLGPTGHLSRPQSIGITLLLVAIVVVMVLGAYLSFSRIKVEDVARLVREEAEAYNRMVADVGSFRIRSVPFRELKRWQKVAYIGLPIMAVIFAAMGVLDMLGIWPSHVVEIRNVRGEMVKMDRITSGMISIMAAIMCLIPMFTIREKFEDDWSESLKRLMREIDGDKPKH